MSDQVPTNGEHRQCAATRRDGQPCQGRAIPGSDYCFAHDPALKQTRDEARSKGGRNKANVVRLRGLMPPRLIPIFELLKEALGEVYDGDLAPSRAQAMASLANAMVRVLQAGELEERVRQIEQRVTGEREAS